MRQRLRIFEIATLAMLALGAMAGTGLAAPAIVPIQGYLTNPDGEPVEGKHRLTFQLYDSAEGGELLYTDDHEGLDVDAGFFVAYVGTHKPLPLELFNDHADVWLEVVIDGEEVVSPRTSLGSVPYAGHAAYCGDAATLGGNEPAFYAQAASFDSHSSDASAHHDRYTNAEAVSALSSHTNNVSAHHDRYTNAEAVSALSSHTNNVSAHHARYGDGEARNALKGSAVVPSSCALSGYVNGWDATLDYTCPSGQVMTGLYSYHDNGKEDRRWRVRCCSLVVQ